MRREYTAYSLNRFRMIVEFTHSEEPVGHLVMVEGRMPGLRIPFHEGVTFIGRTRCATEFKNPEQLAGIVEAAQIWIRYDDGRCWVTDATSTNPTSVFDHELPFQAFEDALDDRQWYEVFPMDELRHIYGTWRIEF